MTVIHLPATQTHSKSVSGHIVTPNPVFVLFKDEGGSIVHMNPPGYPCHPRSLKPTLEPQAEPQRKTRPEGRRWQACGIEVFLPQHLVWVHFWLFRPSWCHYSQSVSRMSWVMHFLCVSNTVFTESKKTSLQTYGVELQHSLRLTQGYNLSSNFNIWSFKSLEALILKNQTLKCS